MDMDKFPCFNAFDTYKVYDGHELEDYTMYYVKALRDDKLSAVLFGSRYSRAYGYKLKRVDCNLFEVLSFKRPSSLIDTHSKERVNKLYNNKKLSQTSKKQIINVLLGLMEKKHNKKSQCQIFPTAEEAQYYVNEFGGKVKHLSYYTDMPDDDSPEIDYDAQRETLYTVVQTCGKELTDGFLPIKEMINDIQRLKLYDMCKTCEKHGIEVHGIKTDCVLVRRRAGPKLLRVFANQIDPDVIGAYKIELDKDLYGECIVMPENNNDSDLLTHTVSNTIELHDEYDKDELGKVNQEHRCILYLATDAGCGKSTASSCGYQKEHVLFVSPFNKQCLELKQDGYDAVTMNKFFGKGLTENNLGKPYDWTGKKLIVFDEVLLNNLYYLGQVKRFVELYKDEVQIIANGDVNQLAPINFNVNNVPSTSEYRSECIKSVFPNIVYLTEIKRLISKKDRRTMKKIKKAIFRGDPIADICEKYGINTCTNMADVETSRNISFFNFRARQVNRHIHKHHTPETAGSEVDGVKIWPGLQIQCKKYHKNKHGFKTVVNNLYTIEQINKYIRVVDLVEPENVFSMDRKVFWKYFDLPYCSTCHKEQGCTIDEEYTIFDSNTPYVDKYWLYTAMTRCRKLSQLSVYIHSEEEVAKLEMAKFKQYINFKIEGYKEQDKSAGRKIDTKNYVDFNWFEQEYAKNSTCYHCNCCFEIDLDEHNKVHSNISFDRLDDEMCHSKDNLVLSCVNCNRCKIKY